jgi:hypothetical protein
LFALGALGFSEKIGKHCDGGDKQREEIGFHWQPAVVERWLPVALPR